MNRKHVLAVAAAALSVALVGCSDSGTGSTGGGAGGGGGSKFCTSTSCATDEICHPTAKLCVKKCSSATDCTGGDKTCGVPVGGSSTAGDAGLVQSCNCTSTSACNTATSGNVCQDFDKICTAKCTKNDDCPNSRTCDTATGMCSGTSSNTDGGTDAGVDAGQPCSWGTSCGTGNVCYFATGQCGAAKTCSTTDGGQGGCDYGHYCNAGTCAEVPRPTGCANFNPDAGGKAAVWNGSSTNGPIIYGLTALPGDNNVNAGMDFCGTNQTYTVQLKAYNANSTFPADNMAAQLGNLKYVREDGNECDAVNCGGGPIFRLQSGYTVSPNLKDITMKISLCSTGGASPASINGGFYFTGGNEACTNIPN